MSAPTSAREQLARLLTLVPYLHSRGEARLEEAADVLGVSPKQLVDDLKVLFMCGLPGGFPDDLIDVDLDALEGPEADGVIRVSNADYLARPLRLTPTEASAVIVALRALRGTATEETRRVVDRALAKLEAAAAEGSAAAQIDPGEDPRAARLAGLAATLQRAAQERRQVRLTYYVPTRDEQSERVVDPRGVVTAMGYSYLDAWCHSAEAPRLFRLDRIDTAEVLDSRVTTPAEPPRDLTEGIFARSEGLTTATLRLAPPARWVVEYYPVDEVRALEDGGLEVDLPVTDERWLIRLVLRLAPHAKVLGPERFTKSSAAVAWDVLRLYEPPA